MTNPRPGEEGSWPYVYTRDGTYRYMSDCHGKNPIYIRIDETDDFDYIREDNGKFVRKT